MNPDTHFEYRHYCTEGAIRSSCRGTNPPNQPTDDEIFQQTTKRCDLVQEGQPPEWSVVLSCSCCSGCFLSASRVAVGCCGLLLLNGILRKPHSMRRFNLNIRTILDIEPVLLLLLVGLAALGRVGVVVQGLAIATPDGGLPSAPTPPRAIQLGMPPPQRLRQLLHRYESLSEENVPLLLPCCYDGLTARLVARAGFEATFMTGFGVSAVRGYSDTQLVSYQEMMNHAILVSEGLESAALEQYQQQQQDGDGKKVFGPPSIIPCIADGDTGYGNSVNVKRTVFGYGRANMAGIMIEDQVSPKRCGHVAGKSTISFDEAIQRVKAATDARDEYEALYGPGTGPLILARTGTCLRTNKEPVWHVFLVFFLRSRLACLLPVCQRSLTLDSAWVLPSKTDTPPSFLSRRGPDGGIRSGH